MLQHRVRGRVFQVSSWSINVLVSLSTQPSKALPDSIRKISIHVSVTCHMPAAGGFAHELALVRSSIRPTDDYSVALRDDILHRCDEVREGRAVCDNTRAIVVGILYPGIQRVMADEFIRQEGFHLSKIAVVPAILEKPTDGGFVVLFRHYSLISVAPVARCDPA